MKQQRIKYAVSPHTFHLRYIFKKEKYKMAFGWKKSIRKYNKNHYWMVYSVNAFILGLRQKQSSVLSCRTFLVKAKESWSILWGQTITLTCQTFLLLYNQKQWAESRWHALRWKTWKHNHVLECVLFLLLSQYTFVCTKTCMYVYTVLKRVWCLSLKKKTKKLLSLLMLYK